MKSKQMEIKQFQDSKQFYERTKDYLLAQEAKHNLLLGIARTLQKNPERFENPYLAVVETDGDIKAIAIRTPPRHLVISQVRDLDAIAIFAQHLHDKGEAIPGVSSLPTEAEKFAKAWQSLTGKAYQLGLQMQIYQLDAVQPVAKVNGYFRVAREGDRALLVEWVKAFEMEALGALEGDPEQSVDRLLSQQTLYFWQDEQPVSMACGNGAPPDGARVNAVYTPPEYRRKGYATACVAALSQSLRDRGCRCCFLFADLANPTSNYVYQKIGYNAMAKWLEYRFE
jgi:predicted GNAT family acetyltransferase